MLRTSAADTKKTTPASKRKQVMPFPKGMVARFGVYIYYIAPNKKEFQNIVRTLAERYHIQMPEEELFLEANKWELSHGGLSGRTAQQFINYLLGFEAE